MRGFRCLLALLVLLGAGSAWAASGRQVVWTMPSSVPVGQPFAVLIDGPAIFDRCELSWMGRTYTLASQNGHYGALLGTRFTYRLAGTNQTAVLTLVSRSSTWRMQRRVALKARQYPEDHLTVEPSSMNPSPDELRRIAAERADVSAALATVSPQTRPVVLPFVRPVDGVVTSPFGETRVFNGQRRGSHGGIDLRATVGTPVKAVVAGRVILTGDHYYAGKSVYVDSGAGLITVYMHLSRIDVKPGQRVQAGQEVALSGDTGRVTGPHLHLGVGLNGRWMDPGPLIGEGELVAGTPRTYDLRPTR